MKKHNALWLLLLALCSIFAGCKKDKTISEIDKLPAATQTGAKTFGCLVNGVIFVPDNGCTYLCSPSMQVGYDLNSNGGQFFVNADNYIFKASLGFGLDSCVTNKRYTYSNSPNYPMRFGFLNNNNLCSLSTRVDPTVIASGYVEITKFDLINDIISGIFEFTLSKNGCETKTITNGRFDAKL